jgi:hypothetical protein
VLPLKALPFMVTLETYSQQNVVGLLAHKGDCPKTSLDKKDNIMRKKILIQFLI